MLDALSAERTPVAERPPAQAERRPDTPKVIGQIDPEAETIAATSSARP
jgi:hypothetical protein